MQVKEKLPYDISDEIYEQMDFIWNEDEWNRIFSEKRAEIDSVPINLILDTNWWIYLTLEENFKFLYKIVEKLNSGEFRILVPQVIIDEWMRNLDTTRDTAQKEIYLQSKNAKGISSFLVEPEKSLLISILDKYRSIEANRVNEIGKIIDIIEDIFKSKSIIIPISEETKDKVIEFGLLKKAPFKTTNSTADAIIFFSSIEFLEKHTDISISSSLFISNNHKDFSKSNDEKDVIHPDLEPFLKKTNTIYEKNIAKALKLSEGMQKNVNEYLNEKAENILVNEYFDAQVDAYIQDRLDVIRGK